MAEKYRKSNSSQVVGIRLPIDVIRDIEKTLNGPRSRFSSVGEYCKEVIIRHIYRHSTRKFKTKFRGQPNPKK